MVSLKRTFDLTISLLALTLLHHCWR